MSLTEFNPATAPHDALELRRRLMYPENAKPDPGICLRRPRGVNGLEFERIKRDQTLAIMKAKQIAKEVEEQLRQERIDKLVAQMNELAQQEKSSRDWLIPSPINGREDQFPPMFFDEIFKTVAQHYKVRRTDITGPRRLVECVRPRQVIVYFARRFTHKSYTQIMKKLGDRDHTCGLHSVRKIKELMITDPDLNDSVEKLEKIFEQKIIEWRADIKV